jgi:hypothetical protein
MTFVLKSSVALGDQLSTGSRHHRPGAQCWETRSTESAGLAVRLGMTVELSMIDP